MKKFFNIAVLFVGFSVLMSCNSMLDINPESDITESVFPTNTHELNAAVIGAYSGLRGPIQLEWRFTEIRTDNTWQAEKGSSSQTNLDLNSLDMFSPRADMLEIYHYWFWTYQYISAANLVLRHLNVVPDTEAALRTQFEAEARFLRAMGHFNLVRLFGPIFLMDDLRTPQEARLMNRVAIPIIYDFIISDLIFASENLPQRHTAANMGRATQYAAKALLARVHMTLRDFESALPLLRAIHETPHHSLVTSPGSAGSAFANVFSLNNEMNDEIIFAVRFNGEAGIGNSFSNDFAPLNSLDHVVNMGVSRGLNAVTWDFFDSFAEYDTIRRDASIGLWRGLGGTEPNRVNQRLYPRKFITPIIGANQSSQDFPIIRYSDVLLMLAETINELDGPTAEVFALINQVRNRAGILHENDVINTGSRLETRLVIENERRWELAFENHRWHDLVRTGRAQEVIHRQIFEVDWEHYLRYDRPPSEADMIQTWQLLLPIPLREILSNNDIIITQNPGY